MVIFDLPDPDWIKRAVWDLPLDPEEVLQIIGGPTRLAHFMTLPAAEAMPPLMLEYFKEFYPEWMPTTTTTDQLPSS